MIEKEEELREEFFKLLQWMQNEPFFQIDDINEILDDYECFKSFKESE